MNKDVYYLISKKDKLPKRCPIFKFCHRRIWSIYFNTYYPEPFNVMIEEREIPPDYEKNKIGFIGESPIFSKNNDFISFKNFCPEISLFPGEHTIDFCSGKAIASGSYIKESSGHYSTNEEKYLHYSECLEFCNYQYFKDKKFKKTKKRRIPISKKLRFEIFQRDNFTCRYCGKKATDGEIMHVDHILPISKGGTDNIDNLCTSCEECNLGKTNKIILPISIDNKPKDT